jgi:hypothetical protein
MAVGHASPLPLGRDSEAVRTHLVNAMATDDPKA